MTYKIDYLDGAVVEWTLTADGASAERVDDYAPTLYASADSRDALADARGHLDRHHRVVRTAVEERRIGFRHDPEAVLRIDVGGIDDVRPLAREIRGFGDPGEFRCYNVDFSREFRYCLENGIDPVPERDLARCDVAVPDAELAGDGIAEVAVDGERYAGSPGAVARWAHDRIDARDPDVLVVSASEIVPELYRAADASGIDDFHLGRLPGWQRLAGRSTYESYGRVVHSPARYNLPGRVIVDRSNAFFWDQTNLDGCLDLVRRSRKPLQELAWASIGNVLTAIQIREALDRNVLVPWTSWRHEFFKTAGQLREADRGGFVFSPGVGLHEDVHELDFSSLYPNVIVTRNVSPETVRCDCHDREDVPGIGYSICDERGYLVDVLEPLIRDRDRIKAELRDVDDPGRREALEGKSNAIKWILVSCFGYQGFSNAKFGRIECHEAINAFAREILLDAKDVLETNGWRVVHGIVDGLWVTPREGADAEPLEPLRREIGDRVGVRLEYETVYDWIAFVPRRSEDSGALTKYFGKHAGEDAFTYRGIECRQRSAPTFVDRVQRRLIRALDEHRRPEAVCDALRVELRRLERGEVDPDDLVIANRVSKRREEYERDTRNVAALERAEARGLAKRPGETVEYVVVDDGKRTRDRVRLAFEEGEAYDAAFYRELTLRAAESVVSPLGWRADDVEDYLDSRRDASITAYE